MNNENANPVGFLAESYSQHVVIRALLQLLPLWGTADTLLQHRAQELVRKRLHLFFSELANGTEDLTEKTIASDDFLHCYFCTLNAVHRSKRAEKIRLFAKLLTAQGHGRFTDTDDYEELLGILDSLSAREFKALELLQTFEAENKDKNFDNELHRAESYWKDFMEAACSHLAIPKQEFNAFMTRLERTGLFKEITGLYLGYTGGIGQTTPLFSRLLTVVTSEPYRHA